MKLYGSLTSPYVRKARVLIAEKELDVEFVVADPTAPDSVVPTHNPLGLVPVLVRADGSPLFDSPVIIEYLDSLAAPAFIPSGGEARWDVLRWMALADGILDQAVGRTMELRRPTEQQSAAANQRREQKIARALKFAEQLLPSGVHLAEERLTAADVGLVVALEYIDFRYPHDWRSTYPRLSKWHARFGTRPAFENTRPPKA